MPPSEASDALRYRRALPALFVAYLVLSGYFVVTGSLNHDEGWYLYAARAVWRGERPYRDFALFQAPLLPYLYGLLQWLTGGSIVAGRWQSFFLSSITVALGARLALLGGGRPAAGLFLITTILTPFELWGLTTTRTEPVTALLLMATALVLPHTSRSRAAACAAAAAMLVAAATRATLLPVAALLLAVLIFRRRQLVVLAPLLLVAMALAPILLAAPGDVTWFNVFGMQADRHNQLQQMPDWTAAQYLVTRARGIMALQSTFGWVPLLALVVGGAATATRARAPESAQGILGGGTLLLAAAAYAPHLVPRVIYSEYFVPIFPLCLAVVAANFGRWVQQARGWQRAALGGAAGVLCVLQVAVFATHFGAHTNWPRSDLRTLRAMGEYLRDVVPAGARLLTMDTYLAVESDRAVLPGWEMGVFAFFPPRPESDGDRFHIVTPQRLVASLRDPTVGAVVLSDWDLGILVRHTRGGYRPAQLLTDADLHRALPALSHFHLTRTYHPFGQFKDTLYVLLPLTGHFGATAAGQVRHDSYGVR
jgi:hypothetical protein